MAKCASPHFGNVISHANNIRCGRVTNWRLLKRDALVASQVRYLRSLMRVSMKNPKGRLRHEAFTVS